MPTRTEDDACPLSDVRNAKKRERLMAHLGSADSAKPCRPARELEACVLLRACLAHDKAPGCVLTPEQSNRWSSLLWRGKMAVEVRMQKSEHMSFEVAAAFVIGVLLPGLETLRRGLDEWSIDFTTMFEDYVAGAVLLIGAWAVLRARRWGRVFILVAWSYVMGMMSSSFWYQLEETVRGTVTEPPIVLIVKMLLWGTCLTAVMLSSAYFFPRDHAARQ